MGHLEIRDNQVWNGGRACNYGTAKYYLDEAAGERVPIQVFVQVYGDGRPAGDVEVQVFSNVNRRDQAKVWEDPARLAGQNSYYLTYPMSQVGQSGNNFIYRAELPLSEDRGLPADHALQIRGDDKWQWHNDFDFDGVKQRDCAVVVSPRKVLGAVDVRSQSAGGRSQAGRRLRPAQHLRGFHRSRPGRLRSVQRALRSSSGSASTHYG